MTLEPEPEPEPEPRPTFHGSETLVKRLAFLLSQKRHVKYADAITWLRRSIAFSLLCASSPGLRGATSKRHAPQRLSDTSIPATNAITLSQI